MKRKLNHPQGKKGSRVRIIVVDSCLEEADRVDKGFPFVPLYFWLSPSSSPTFCMATGIN